MASNDKHAPLLDGGVRNTTSNFMTAINLINNYVGMVLLSMPYAFARCGWLAMVLLLVLTAFGAWTADLLIQSYKAISDDGVSVPSYAQIGERCMGRSGKWLVLISSVVETWAAALCILIIIWENAVLLLPNVGRSWIIGGCCALLFPTNWLRDFSLLSVLSAFGNGCVVLIILVVVYAFGLHVAGADGPDAPQPATELADWSGVAMSSSIMLAGLTGHVSLPPMYAEMKTPSAFRRVLYASFAVMAAMYLVVGACGYALYGDDANILITSDMSRQWREQRTRSSGHASSSVDGADDGADGGGFSLGALLVDLVLGGITVKLYASFPMTIVTIVDIVETTYHEQVGSRLSMRSVDVVRVALWTVIVLNAVVVYSSLQYVTALIGINSILISILLPIVCHFLLFGRAMSPPRRAVQLALMGLSFVLSWAVCYIDWGEFLESISRPPGDGSGVAR